MNQDVNEENVETTTTVEETATDQTTESTEENVSVQSGEDNNAPDAESTQYESVEGEEPSEQNEYKTNFAQENEQLVNFENNLQAQLTQAQIGGNLNLSAVAELQLLQMRSQLTRLEEEKKWDQAFKKYPEVQKDKSLDDLVYKTYIAEKERNPYVTPVQVADEVMKVLGKYKKDALNRGYQQAEDDISEKMYGSRTPSRRSPSKGEEDLRRKAVEKYQETGDERHLLDTLTY